MKRTETFQALSYGPEVAALISSGGRILALLSNVIYLESYEGYVAAIVGEDSVDGPLSIRVPNLRVLLSLVRGWHDLNFRATAESIELDALLKISLCHARQWTPSLPTRLGTSSSRFEAIDTLAETIAGYHRVKTLDPLQMPALAHLFAPCQSERSEESKELTRVSSRHLRFFAALGLTEIALVAEPQHQSPADLVHRRLAIGINNFTNAFRSSDTTAASTSVTSLIGLGPGLTPSGDDIVCGVVAALIWQTRLGAIRDDSTQEIVSGVRGAASRTNRISARLLHHACQGIVYAPAMELGAALLAGHSDGIAGPAARLFAIGHSTGVDLAAGLLVGCTATWPAN